MITALIIQALDQPHKPYLFISFSRSTYYWSPTSVHDATAEQTYHSYTLAQWIKAAPFKHEIITAFSDNFQTPTDFTELQI